MLTAEPLVLQLGVIVKNVNDRGPQDRDRRTRHERGIAVDLMAKS